MEQAWVGDLIRHWRNDEAGTYRTWFLWDARIKNFRSIRRGLQEVMAEIKADTFGNAYRGSSLETVLDSIAEQRQVFKGADHAFMWKPKLRIPDIYENRPNQVAFGNFLDTCLCCNTEEHVIEAIQKLDRATIKGLGPAAANLLYFLHPTIAPPFNTAIVRGYNALTGADVKLGRWEQYLAMRRGVLALNSQYRNLLSNDLGAAAAFLFEVGTGRYPLPERQEDGSLDRWRSDLDQVRAESAASSKAVAAAREADHTHTEIQGWLRDLGLALGFQVWIASNDGARSYKDGRLANGCLDRLPAALAEAGAADAIRLIHVLWIEQAAMWLPRSKSNTPPASIPASSGCSTLRWASMVPQRATSSSWLRTTARAKLERSLPGRRSHGSPNSTFVICHTASCGTTATPLPALETASRESWRLLG